MDHGFYEDASLLAVVADDPRLKLAMWECLFGADADSSMFREELARTREKYPEVSPDLLKVAVAPVFWERHGADRYGSWKGYSAAIQEDSRRVRVSTSLELLRRSTATEVDELRRQRPWGHFSVEEAFLDCEWPKVTRSAGSPRQLAEIAWTVLRRDHGRLPAALLAELRRAPASPPVDAILALSGPDRARRWLGSLAVGSEATVRALRRYLAFGGESRLVLASQFESKVLGAVWTELAIEAKSPVEARRAMSQLLRTCATAPAYYATCRAAILAAASGEPEPKGFADWLLRRRETKAYRRDAKRTVQDLGKLRSPVGRVDAFYSTVLPGLEDEKQVSEGITRLLTLVVPTTLGPVTHTIASYLRCREEQGRLGGETLEELRRALLIVEVLVHHLEERNPAFLSMVEELSALAPGAARSLLRLLPIESEQAQLLELEVAYRSDARTFRRVARRKSGLGSLYGHLATAIQHLVSGKPDHKKALVAWCAAGAGPTPFAQPWDLRWVLVGMLLCAEAVVDSLVLEELSTTPHELGRALIRVLRRGAGALSEVGGEETADSDDLVEHLLLAAGDPEMAKEALEQGFGGPYKRAGTRATPLEGCWLERWPLVVVAQPLRAGLDLEEARTGDALVRVVVAPGLGAEDSVFKERLVKRVEEASQSEGSHVAEEICEQILNWELSVSQQVGLRLARRRRDPELPRYVRQLDSGALERMQVSFERYFAACPRDAETRAAVGERSPFLGLRLLEGPASPVARDRLRALIVEATRLLAETKTADEAHRALRNGSRTIEITASACAQVERLQEVHPDVITSVRRELQDLLLGDQALVQRRLRSKTNSVFSGLGEGGEPHRVLLLFVQDTFQLFRIYGLHEHDTYERAIEAGKAIAKEPLVALEHDSPLVVEPWRG
jgi:hypothetical protein